MVEPNWLDFFDSHAERYDDEPFTQGTEREVVFLTEELALQPGSLLLDVGCGTGRHAVPLAARGITVTGLDLSKGMLRRALARSGRGSVPLHLIHANARWLPVRSSTFDAVTCLCEGSLCLLGTFDDPYDRDVEILAEIRRVLRPGGLFLTTVLNAGRLYRTLDDDAARGGAFDPVTGVAHDVVDTERDGIRLQVETRERLYTPAEFVRMARGVGFHVEHVYAGTAGAWSREPPKLHEYEFMIVARV